MKRRTDAVRSRARRMFIPHYDQLPENVDPYNCHGCLADGSPCDFHLGFSQGWDICAAFVAAAAEAVTGDD